MENKLNSKKEEGKAMYAKEDLFIDNNTISTIKTQKDGTIILTIYFEKRVLHKKAYKTFSAAKAQETRLLKHYKLSCY